MFKKYKKKKNKNSDSHLSSIDNNNKKYII